CLLVWIVSGHAFAGFFLTEQRLNETVSSDPNHMINLVVSHRALAVELTGIGPGGDGMDYSQAVRAGGAHFRARNADLLAVVDIALAHRSGLKSLPSPEEFASDSEQQAQQAEPAAAFALPEELLHSTAFTAEPNLATGDEQSSGAPQRIEKWRKELLDLS